MEFCFVVVRACAYFLFLFCFSLCLWFFALLAALLPILSFFLFIKAFDSETTTVLFFCFLGIFYQLALVNTASILSLFFYDPFYFLFMCIPHPLFILRYNDVSSFLPSFLSSIPTSIPIDASGFCQWATLD